MGLDWNPGNKPKPGFEAEWKDILERMAKAIGRERAALETRFEEITIPAYTTLGAPIVGRDRRADGWLLAQHRDPPDPDPRPRSEEERARLERAAGYHVLQLVPSCDGLPVYTNAAVNRELELVSFRAQFLQDCAKEIGDELVSRAYARLPPDALVTYGDALLAHARRLDPSLEHRRDPPDAEEGSREAQAHILFAAGKWCRFWGKRGHFLDPWY